MPQVPIYNQPAVRNQRTPQGYNQVSVNGDMVGENIARANYVLGRMSENISTNIEKQLDQLAKPKMLNRAYMIRITDIFIKPVKVPPGRHPL